MPEDNRGGRAGNLGRLRWEIGPCTVCNNYSYLEAKLNQIAKLAAVLGTNASVAKNMIKAMKGDHDGCKIQERLQKERETEKEV
jgi:hypothetical protein